MELCAGGELFHRLEKQGCFSEHEAAILFQHLMEVVTYCHDKGVVHRDLKPENILMATKSLSSPIKLADFGLATYIKPGQNLSGTVGSPFYIAPEVLSGGYNEAADVWSAGVILYILLSGMPPFWGKTKSRIFDSVRSSELRFPSDPWDNVSDSAKELIRGMLCRNPSRRFTAKQVLDHTWFRECAQQSKVQCGQCKEISLTHGDLGSCSFATLSVSRDVSFSSPASVPCQTVEDKSSPAFTCRSSFSSFIVDTPCLLDIGFSFHSTSESNSIGLQSPIPVMPSFAFFSEDSEQQRPFSFTMDESKVDISKIELRSPKMSHLRIWIQPLDVNPETQIRRVLRAEEVSQPIPESLASTAEGTTQLGLGSSSSSTSLFQSRSCGGHHAHTFQLHQILGPPLFVDISYGLHHYFAATLSCGLNLFIPFG